MGNLFGGLARPGNNRGATAEAIPMVRDKATESKKEAERYTPMVTQPVRTQHYFAYIRGNYACVIIRRSLSIRGRVTSPVISISVSLAA